MKKIYLLFALLVATQMLFAQNPFCGNDSLLNGDSTSSIYYDMIKENVKWWRQNRIDTGYLDDGLGGQPNGFNKMQYIPGCERAKILIPVVVHIVHATTDNTPGVGSNVSDFQVENMIQELNAHLANALNAPSPARNTGIQLCLATKKPDGTTFSGITRIGHPYTVHSIPSQIDTVMKIDLYDPDQYLNIWLVSQINNDNSGGGSPTFTAGYAPFPFLRQKFGSGIVMRYDFAGNANTCTGCNLDSRARGAIAAHELGHYLGVFHPFQDGCVGLTTTTCSLEGDLCCDVPPVSSPTYSCSAQNTCSEIPDSSDQKRNYMDYSPETCQNTFTQDQIDIMYSTLYLVKQSLWNPANVNAKNLGCCFLSASFAANELSRCDSGTITFTGVDYDSAMYRWKVYKGSTLLKDSLTSSFTYAHQFTDTGKYTLELTVIVQGDSVSDTRLNYIFIRHCADLEPSTQANWYFGNEAGLRFTGGGADADNAIPVRNIPPKLNATLSTVTQSNESGNLLFYAGHANADRDEVYVYNKNFAAVPNSPILGDNAADQNLLVVPNPADGKQFYIFSANARTSPSTKMGLRYSVFDSTLNSFAGDIVSSQKDIPVKIPSSGFEYAAFDSAIGCMSITAIPKCNNVDYWIITAYNDSNTIIDGKLLVYSLTSTGLTHHHTSSFDIWTSTGGIKSSPDGNWLYLGQDLIAFDRGTGIPTHVDLISGIVKSISFSPDSRLLYLSRLDLATSAFEALYQFDLYASGFEASRFNVSLSQPIGVGQLQLGLDGKIYKAEAGSDKLSVITKPNERCTPNNPNACGFEPFSQSLSINGIGGKSRFGLPNMIDARKIADIPSAFYIRQKSCDSVEFKYTKPCVSTIKWFFGDGDSSTVHNPTHVYSSKGEYIVSVIADGQTFTDTIYIGIRPTTIAGDTTVCDTSRAYSYSAPFEAKYEYSWKASPASPATLGDFINYDLNWLGSGTVQLNVSEYGTGCVDSFTKTVTIAPALNNNIIGSDQTVCNEDTAAQLLGTTPSGGLGNYTYEWLKSIDSVSWQTLNNATGASYTPLPIFNTKTYYVRIVSSSSCQSTSNITTITPHIAENFIQVDTQACIKGQKFYASGGTEGNRAYFWFYSLDSSNWHILPNGFQSFYNDTIFYDSMYVKRRSVATDISCQTEGNTILVKPHIYISKQPQNNDACNGSTRTFTIEVEKTDTASISYQWEYQPSGTSSWLDAGTNQTFVDGGTSFSHAGDAYRCKVITACGTVISDTAMVNVHTSPTISSHPSNKTANEGSNTSFTVSGSSTASLQYLWQFSYDNGSSWNNLLNDTTDTLSLGNLSKCQKNYQYRAIVSNLCGDIASNAATLTVTTTRFDDLWMKDGKWDQGVEPNLVDSSIYNTPDLWNRLPNSSYDTLHENPDYHPSDSNVLYFRIRNRGLDTSKGGEKLYLYWTLGGLGEKWPDKWTANPNNLYRHPCNGVNFNQYFPEGKEINIDPIIIPPIAPGDTFIGSVRWIPPNPYWYCKKVNGLDDFDDERDVCLLARLLTCDIDSFGLSRKETSLIGTNVRNNNNIVTKNTKVTNIGQFNKKSAPTWHFVRSVQEVDSCFHLNFKAEDLLYYAIGTATITVDDYLWASWKDGGSNGTGFTVPDSNVFLVNPAQPFSLQNLCLADSTNAQVSVTFEIDSAYSWSEEENYYFVMRQMSMIDSTEIGGYDYQVKLTVDGGAAGFVIPKDEQRDESDRSEKVIDRESIEKTDKGSNQILSVYPNPFTHTLNIEFTLQGDGKAEISLQNLYGQTVQSISRNEFSEGKHKVQFNSKGLRAGVYFVVFRSEHLNKTIKVALQNY